MITNYSNFRQNTFLVKKEDLKFCHSLKSMGPATAEKFCLRWNDFESNITGAFKELREDKDFFDVILACADGQIQAHKLILSACSTFFRTILRRNKHEHPLVYLKGSSILTWCLSSTLCTTGRSTWLRKNSAHFWLLLKNSK